MSAFLVSGYHIDCMIQYAINRPITFNISGWELTPTEGATKDPEAHANILKRILVEENYRSVNTRYERHDKPTASDLLFHPVTNAKHLTNLQIAKACSCYDYQTCETDDYTETVAHEICQRIEYVALYHAASDLPEYEAAQWEIGRNE